MREMLFRDLNSDDRRKKDLILTELREEDGISTRVEKRYTYSVTAVTRPTNLQDAPAAMQLPDSWSLWANPERPRQVFVRKSRDKHDGSEYFTYKIVGSFYAVQEAVTYLVKYRHILHMAVGDESASLLADRLRRQAELLDQA